MKIFCLIASLRLGGAERQMTGLAEALAEGGHEVAVITYRPGDFYEDRLLSRGIRHIRIRSGNDAGIIRNIVRRLRSEGAGCMISYLQGTNIKACLIGALCPKVRIIVSERTSSLRPTLFDAFKFALYRKFASDVVCNNFAQEAFIRKYFPGLAPKVVTIPNFVDTYTFFPGPARTPQGRILVISRICRRKNTSGLIEAAGRLATEEIPFRIDWYGLTRENGYVRRCRKRIARLGIGDRFFFHPARREVSDLYREADYFCLPSFYEGTSNALAEALACGVPAACSGVSDNGRYVIDGKTGFIFDPHDPESMALALSELLSLDSNARSAMGEAARRTVATGLSREAFAENYMNLLGRKD